MISHEARSFRGFKPHSLHLRHMPVQSVVYKKAFSLARTACTALVPDIVNTIQMKAVFVKVFTQIFHFYKVSLLGFVCIVKLQVNYSKSIFIFILILKRKLFTTNALIRLFKLYEV